MTEIRYLDGKRTVDDRSLSRRVIDQLCSSLPDQPSIFEAGCGTGVTVPRLTDWGITDADYVGVDTSAELVREASSRWADEHSGGTDTRTVQFETGDALDAIEHRPPQDLLIAQQFLDLVDIDRALDVFTNALRPGGLAYFPLTFDGISIFEPAHPEDEAMMAAYHDSMDQRPNGNSKAGRHLATALRELPGELLAMDSADAIVRPQGGSYPADEQYVLETILDFVAEEIPTRAVPARDEWLSTRREQIEKGELLYVAHRYDLLYRKSD